MFPFSSINNTGTGTGTGGTVQSVFGLPSTGLFNPNTQPVSILNGTTITEIVQGLPSYDSRTIDIAYLLWEIRINNGNVINAFAGDGLSQTRDKSIWVWFACTNSWWKLDHTNLSGNGTFTTDPAGQIVQLTQGDGFTGDVWSTYDRAKGEWITKTGWDTICDVVDDPRSDCEKYGINCPEELPTGKIYTRIPIVDKLPSRSEIKTYGIWSENLGTLRNVFTASLSGSVQPYHQTVLNKAIGVCGSEPQFDIAYGNDNGSGSIDIGQIHDYMSPTNATYGQYRLLALGEESERFKLGDKELEHVYVLNVRRARMQERLDEGNIELNLAPLSGSEFIQGGGTNAAHTGSNVTLSGTNQVIRLIDDSVIKFDDLSEFARSGSYKDQVDNSAHRVGHGGEVYYMVSGSIEQGIYNKDNPHIYGLLYPRLGFIVLDADLMDTSCSFQTVTGSQIAGDNAMKMFTAISGGALQTDASGDGLGFTARRKEVEFAEYFFVRVKNGDYNYTNNPTFTTGSDNIIDDNFRDNPTVYISSVGLYNERKECLAIAKVSRPLLKTCTHEALFKIRLKY